MMIKKNLTSSSIKKTFYNLINRCLNNRSKNIIYLSFEIIFDIVKHADIFGHLKKYK